MLLPLWNVWYFFSLYANAERGRGQVPAATRTHLLDRYLLAKTARAGRPTSTAAMDGYDLSAARVRSGPVLLGRADQLVRAPRPRDRFWAGDRDAIDTLYTVLEALCAGDGAAAAADDRGRSGGGLTGGRSVHLTDWPTSPTSCPADLALVSAMDAVRDVCSAALSLRKAAGCGSG